jgi:hypothetical protein
VLLDSLAPGHALERVEARVSSIRSIRDARDRATADHADQFLALLLRRHVCGTARHSDTE